MADLIEVLLNEIVEEKELLKKILDESIQIDVKDLLKENLLDRWDNFQVQALKPIFKNHLMVDKASLIRITVCFDTAGKLIAYLNGYGGYLNGGNDLSAECIYAFDIPLNSGDAFNLAYSVDAVCKFIRIQVVK